MMNTFRLFAALAVLGFTFGCQPQDEPDVDTDVIVDTGEPTTVDTPVAPAESNVTDIGEFPHSNVTDSPELPTTEPETPATETEPPVVIEEEAPEPAAEPIEIEEPAATDETQEPEAEPQL